MNLRYNDLTKTCSGDFGDPLKIFCDPKKGRDSQFENRWSPGGTQKQKPNFNDDFFIWEYGTS